MYPTPVLWFEIGAVAIVAVAILWTNVEYGLFLYAFALGFPDVACSIGTAINIRVDDVLLLVFLGRMAFWCPSPLSPKQRNIVMWQSIFLACCIFSIAVESAHATPPAAYETVKMAGCAGIFLVLPRVIESERRLRFFIAGLMCAGVALVIQVRAHLGASSSSDFANIQELKSAVTFGTWNANTIGQAAILMVFAAGLGGIIHSRTLVGQILWRSLSAGFALMPALMFVRGTTLSIAAGILLFLALIRRWSWIVVFTLVCTCAFFYVHSRDARLTQDAVTVNLSTGEGLSHRFDRWGVAFQGIQKDPWFGHGFAQEMTYLDSLGSEGRAHNAYLAVWLELGVGGLFLLLTFIFQFARAGLSLCQTPPYRARGALILGLIAVLSVDSLGLPTLYWEKLPSIALSLALAVIGMCERKEAETAVRELNAFAYEPFAQSS